MPLQSTTSLSRWEFTKDNSTSSLSSTLLSESLLDVTLTPLPLYIFIHHFPCCLDFLMIVLTWLYASALKVLCNRYTDDDDALDLMSYNIIIPPPCSLLTSPTPPTHCCEGGSLRETLAYTRICSQLMFLSGIAFSSSEPSNLSFCSLPALSLMSPFYVFT